MFFTRLVPNLRRKERCGKEHAEGELDKIRALSRVLRPLRVFKGTNEFVSYFQYFKGPNRNCTHPQSKCTGK